MRCRASLAGSALSLQIAAPEQHQPSLQEQQGEPASFTRLSCVHSYREESCPRTSQGLTVKERGEFPPSVFLSLLSHTGVSPDMCTEPKSAPISFCVGNRRQFMHTLPLPFAQHLPNASAPKWCLDPRDWGQQLVLVLPGFSFLSLSLTFSSLALSLFLFLSVPSSPSRRV